MNQRKLYTSPGFLMSLAAVLVLGCLIVAVGISYARYRTDESLQYQFQAEQNASVWLWQIDENNAYVQEESIWKTADGQLQLKFAVSNGTDRDHVTSVDQQVRIRVIASLGAWREDTSADLTLTVDAVEYAVTATPIKQGSALHRSFGDGWVLSFRDAEGKEPTWLLSKDELTYLNMQLSLTSDEVMNTELLQLQVISEN